MKDSRIIQINDKIIELEYPIRKCVEYDNSFVVLMYDETIAANNVVCFDRQGVEQWRINDILNIKKPTGNVDIIKGNESILQVHSVLGMVFKIGVERKELIEKTFRR